MIDISTMKENFYRSALASPVTRFLIGLFLGLIFVGSLVNHSDGVFSLWKRWTVATTTKSQAAPPPSKLVQELIDKIRHATLVAGGESNSVFSEDERQVWEKDNPCRSRSELKSVYSRRRHVKDIADNWQWDLVVKEYEKLHRTCIRGVGNITQYLLTRNTSTGCKFLVGEAHYGLGNKILHLSSSFLYAVLSQRVFLLTKGTVIPAFMCEPFAGSSWIVENCLYEQIKSSRKRSWQLYAAIDDEKVRKRPFEVLASQIDDTWQPETRFWCDTEQSFISNVTWLTVDGCLYFLQKFFVIPMFRPVLEALFPEKIALTYVLRSIMLPGDIVWERIWNVYESYLENAGKRVGIQIRFLQGKRYYDHVQQHVNDRVTSCLVENGILPKVCQEIEGVNGKLEITNCTRKGEASNPRILKVLVASLFLGLHDHLSNIYLRHETETGDAVGLVQLTHGSVQGQGLEEDMEALVEIMTLSFSDTLLVTPKSTFGHISAAYGGLAPWYIDFNFTMPESCVKAISKEPCNLGGNGRLDCKYDNYPQDTSIFDYVPYISQCMPIEEDGGLLMHTEEPHR